MTLSNALVFNIALLAALAAFWAEGYLLLGILIVLLVGSNGFQLYEIYQDNNINGYPICGVLLGLALHLRYMSGRVSAGRGAWATAAIMGVFVLSC